MLPHDIGMDIARVNREIAAKHIPETGGIEGSSGANHPVRVKPGQLQSDMGHDIHRIGRNQEDSLESGVHHRLHDRLEYRCIPLEQVCAGLTRLLCHPRADRYNICIFTVGVISCPDFHVRAGKSKAVVQVHRFPLRALAVDVYQNQLIADVLVHECIRKAHAHQTCPNQYHLSFIRCLHVSPPSFQFESVIKNPAKPVLSACPASKVLLDFFAPA